MKPSEKAKRLGFKSLLQVAKIIGVSETTLIRCNQNNSKKFDDYLIGAKHKLCLAEIDFYRECADMEGVSFEEWWNSRGDI
tara:strand:- start:304 stop:546 length:243 start_codon:yes stop_codon:yes gene_type:complete